MKTSIPVEKNDVLKEALRIIYAKRGRTLEGDPEKAEKLWETAKLIESIFDIKKEKI